MNILLKFRCYTGRQNSLLCLFPGLPLNYIILYNVEPFLFTISVTISFILPQQGNHNNP